MSKSIHSKGFIHEEANGGTIGYPVLNSHNFKERQEVVEGKDYEKKLHQDLGEGSYTVALPLNQSVQDDNLVKRIVSDIEDGKNVVTFSILSPAPTSQGDISAMQIEEVIENKMTWEDVMKRYKPDITDDHAHNILWEHTCYPFDARMTLTQIHEYFNNSKIKP